MYNISPTANVGYNQTTSTFKPKSGGRSSSKPMVMIGEEDSEESALDEDDFSEHSSHHAQNEMQ